MKQLEIFFRTFFLVAAILLLGETPVSAQEGIPMDSVEISLITCSPHEEIYSLYGHSALRYHELNTGRDLIFNYGLFNFKASHFILRFIFGKTDYELGIAPTNGFCRYYRRWGSMVTEQVLNLTSKEKEQVMRALSENLLPENRVYRYNFLYDNCSTRPRDIIERNIQGKLIYADRDNFHPSYRTMIHEMTKNHPWAALGNDLLLGFKADWKTTRSEQEFLPHNLLHDFDYAQIYANGEYRPLVKERRLMVPAGIQMIESDFPLTPTECAVLLLLLAMFVFLTEWRRKRCYVWFDAIIMLLTGAAGCILFVMFFSEHPTTSTNLQILLFCPISLYFIPLVVRRKKTRYWQLLLIQATLFLLGGLIQDYAEGTEILALILLTRYWSHIRNDK